MRVFPEIIPLYDAYIYLCARFSNIRTADNIRLFETQFKDLSDSKRTYYDKIIDIQDSLDELIKPDELFKYYFSPLKTKEDLSVRGPLSLGGILLHQFSGLKSPYSFDELVKYYETAPQKDLLVSYHSNILEPFYSDGCDLADINMSVIVSSLNSILVETEDKWAIIDCISNPIEHLKKLRPLVTRVMSIITEKSDELSGFITNETEQLFAPNCANKNLGEILSAGINSKNYANADLYTSLFNFSGVFLSYDLESLVINKIILGISANMIVERRKARANDDAYIELLKMLSDRNRFRILHSLCGKESYGQELADKFGGARSGIYYHLEKLLGYGLLNVNMTEYRTLYTMNRKNVYDSLTALRDYLVDGWKPENAE